MECGRFIGSVVRAVLDEVLGLGGGGFPFCFNWKLKFLDKGETESHLAESLFSAGAK